MSIERTHCGTRSHAGRSRPIASILTALACLAAAGCDTESPTAAPVSRPGNLSTEAPPAAPSLVAVPDPLSGLNETMLLERGPVPDAGQRFRDTRFGTTITRVTQEPGVRHEYARFDPFNRDRSMIILLRAESGERMVYRTETAPYDTTSSLVVMLDLEEPRWDPEDPNVIWGLDELRIVTIDCRTDQQTVIKDFAADPTIGPIVAREPDLYRITTRDEGESSRDKRFWAFMLQGTEQDYRHRYLFTWDRTADRVPGVRALEPSDEVDWVGMSWHGTWVIVGGDPGRGPLSGLVMANRELTRFHRLETSSAHSDVGLDVDGREVVVMQNTATDFIDLIPLDWNTTPVHDDDEPYAGTNRTPLVRLFYASDSPHGMNAGVHISCNAPGMCVVSTYLEPDIPERNWLDRSIIALTLDPAAPRAAYLAKVHNTCGDYWEEPHATVSDDGSRVVWATNWGRDAGAARVFLVQLEVPSSWREELTGAGGATAYISNAEDDR